MKTGIVLLGLACLAMVACTPTDGIVAEFNGDSVTIRQPTVVNIPGLTPQIEAEASRICGTADKRAEFASTLQPPSAAYADHLFLCL